MHLSNDSYLLEFTPSSLTDLESCSDESVYAPGYIQPYGMLLHLQGLDLKILQVSENVEKILGLSPEALLGQPLQQLFSPVQVQTIAPYLTQGSSQLHHSFELETQYRFVQKDQHQKPQRFRGMLHRLVEDELILELESIPEDKTTNVLQFYDYLQGAIVNLRSATSVTHLAQTLAREVKMLTGFDRVMIYRFEADHSGVVIAEEQESPLSSYLGLHFPAIDIPVPARKLFYRNWLRYIPDVNYTPARLIPEPNPLRNTPLDLSESRLRGVSPYHVEYLQNMGVAGSMTISLIDDQRLWGLIACHHYCNKMVDYEIRQACEFLGQFASIQLVYQQEQELRVYRQQTKGLQDQLQSTLLQESNFIEQVLTRNTSQLLDLVHAQGAAIILDNHLTLVGQTPSESEVWSLVTWLMQKQKERVFATDALSSLYPEAKEFKDKACGILAISIQLSDVKQKSYQIIWFRPEQIQSVNWAGNIHDAVNLNEFGEMQLCPRKSFELWEQTVREMSLPWQIAELEAAAEMRNTLMLAVLEFSQKALEQAAEQAEIGNRAKTDFIAKMSHELRTPLNAILGFSQLIGRSHSITSECQQHLGIIRRSGEHLLSLINDVLEVSKIEAGQLRLVDRCFNLFRFIYSMHKMFALRASEKGIQLIIKQDENIPHYVYGDESKLRQILINLLSNAIKFTAQGQIILRIQVFYKNVYSSLLQQYCPLTLPYEEKDSLEDSSQVCEQIILRFEIEDTGCGIAVGDWESIFEAFSQTDRGRQAQGTGLGLSISRQFARLMGGDITLKSRLNHGSTFTCEVALSIPESIDLVEFEFSPQVIGLEADQPNYRILVAEDISENRQLLVRLLESVGFEVCGVENGAEAIAKWQNWQPDLIFMDIQMPVLNGYEAVRHIRAQELSAVDSIPIKGDRKISKIIATAYPFEQDHITSLTVGCNDFMAKPFTESILFEKISRHLKVRYRYYDVSVSTQTLINPQAKKLFPKDLDIMSSLWIYQIHEAALDLNDEKLHKLIDQIPVEQNFLIESLTYLVDNFQLEAIAALTFTPGDHHDHFA